MFSTEGNKDVHIRAKDTAGNVGSWVTKTFTYDKSVPVINSPMTIKIGETEVSSSLLGGSFLASGTVTDSFKLTGDDFSLTVKKDGEQLSDVAVTTTKVSDTEYTWSCDITAETSGSYEITADATDSSGKSAKSVTRTVNVDTDAPKLTVSVDSILPGTSNKISGTVEDEPKDKTNAGVSKLQYRIYNKDSVPAAEDGWTDITLAQKWNIPLTFDGENGLAEGNHTVEIRAEDAVGNKATNASADFMVDKTPPSVMY